MITIIWLVKLCRMAKGTWHQSTKKAWALPVCTASLTINGNNFVLSRFEASLYTVTGTGREMERVREGKKKRKR